MNVKVLCCVLALLLCALSAPAQSPGPPETVLADIDIHHATIPEIEKLYGEPEGVFAAPAPYPVGTKQYKWGRLTVTLRVLTEPTSTGDAITAIQIDGDGDGKPVSRTGRGLKLGDKAKALHKLYGVEPAATFAKLRWPTGESLLVHLDARSRVDRLELTFNPPSR
jgi:hypothetical protein